MKQLSLLLISSIIASSPLLSMEIQPHKTSLEKYNKQYPGLCTLQEKGFFIVTQNLYASAQGDPSVASCILHDVSLIDKKVYKALDKERKDPITARDIIIQFALSKDGFKPDIAKKLIFPGAKKSIASSKILCDKNNLPTTIELLFEQGAILNYWSSQIDMRSPLSYWTQSNEKNSIMNMEKLIALGADPNCEAIWDNNSFIVAIQKQNPDKLKVLLNYYTLMQGKSTTCIPMWSKILDLYYRGSEHYTGYEQCQKLINLFITKIPKENCSLGLMACTNANDLNVALRTQLIQKFIAGGADTGLVLPYLLKTIHLSGPDYSQSTFIQEFNVLCNDGAFNKEALTTLQGVRQLFDCLITKLEHNSPK